MTITHHQTCRADYPEKVKGEVPQQITREILEDGYWIDTCVDCGAFATNLPPDEDSYWDDVRSCLEAGDK